MRLCVYIFVLLMWLSGCITIKIVNEEGNSKWLEVTSLPGVTEVSPTISPSPMSTPAQSKIYQIPQPAIEPDTWYFVVVTRQGSRVIIYLDGRVAAWGEFYALNLDTPVSLKFGRREGRQGFYLNGRIDEVEIYNGIALTSEKIFRLYSAGSRGKCQGSSISECVLSSVGLTGWWPGDGSTKEIVSSRNGNFMGGATTGPGLMYQAFVLDGQNDYIEVPDDPALNFGPGNFTVDMWVNFNDLSGEQVLIEKWVQEEGQEHPFSQGWTLTKLANQDLLFSMADGKGGEWGVAIVPQAYSTATPTTTPIASPSESP